MLTQNLLIVFAIGGVLAVLTILQAWLASRADHALGLVPKLESEKAVDERIKEKRLTQSDLEEELKKRREALATVSDMQAEADALERQRDELLAEWNQLDERRQEVRAVRQDIETILNEKLVLDGDFATKQAELEEVQERLSRADRLVHRIEELRNEHETVEAKVVTLRDQLRRLEDAEARAAEMDKRAYDLENSLASKEGKLEALEAETSELRHRSDAQRASLAELEGQRSQLVAELAAGGIAVREHDDRKNQLEARAAVLEREIAKLEGRASGQPNAEVDDDQLSDLKKHPPAIVTMLNWNEAGLMLEQDALKKVKDRFRALGLDYADRTLNAFHTSMKVNESTQMAVLAGISGTGKSQLPRQYAEGMGIGFLQVPVQPRWDSPQDLMGFYNYIEGRFRPTDMARALYALDPLNNEDAIKDRMMMVLLDEMNLARVEYYFSDFLSRLESRPTLKNVSVHSERKDAEIELEIPKMANPPRIFPGYNLLFAGTMNEDESTQSLSDKVVDRANILRFAAPKKIKRGEGEGKLPQTEALPLTRWQSWSDRSLSAGDTRDAEDKVETMVSLMKEFGRPFGHRLGRAMLSYASKYPETEGVSNKLQVALADQVEMRLLPKLRGVEVDQKRAQFDQLEELVTGLGDETLAQAIKESVDAAETSDQFSWLGVTRQ